MLLKLTSIGQWMMALGSLGLGVVIDWYLNTNLGGPALIVMAVLLAVTAAYLCAALFWLGILDRWLSLLIWRNISRGYDRAAALETRRAQERALHEALRDVAGYYNAPVNGFETPPLGSPTARPAQRPTPPERGQGTTRLRNNAGNNVERDW